jgi:hypothetical protein
VVARTLPPNKPVVLTVRAASLRSAARPAAHRPAVMPGRFGGVRVGLADRGPRGRWLGKQDGSEDAGPLPRGRARIGRGKGPCHSQTGTTRPPHVRARAGRGPQVSAGHRISGDAAPAGAIDSMSMMAARLGTCVLAGAGDAILASLAACAARRSVAITLQAHRGESWARSAGGGGTGVAVAEVFNASEVQPVVPRKARTSRAGTHRSGSVVERRPPSRVGHQDDYNVDLRDAGGRAHGSRSPHSSPCHLWHNNAVLLTVRAASQARQPARQQTAQPFSRPRHGRRSRGSKVRMTSSCGLNLSCGAGRETCPEPAKTLATRGGTDACGAEAACGERSAAA